MMPMAKKKGPSVTVAFIGGGKPKPRSEDDASDEYETEDESTLSAMTEKKALTDFAAALGADPKAIDHDKANTALKSFIEACYPQLGEYEDSE